MQIKVRAVSAFQPGHLADVGYGSCAAPCCQPLTAPTRGEECEMSTTAKISEPASELERLIAELSGPGLQGVFVFGVDCQLAPLAGATTPVFRGPADRRWWHGVLGDEAASRTMDVRVDEVTGVRFVRKPSLFPAWPGQEVLAVQFLGPGGESVLHCFVDDLYDGRRMRPEKLQAWQALRERYGNRDESRVDRGRLLPRPI